MTSYFPGDRDKESTHSPFSPCTNHVGCVRCWGNFAETNRLALNGLKLWSPVTRVSSVVLGLFRDERVRARDVTATLALHSDILSVTDTY